MGEGTVEGVEPGLPVSVVGECPRLVVQKHANAAVLWGDGHSLPPAVVPGAELMLVQLQAPGQFVHTHHAPLALLLSGDGLIGNLVGERIRGSVSSKESDSDELVNVNTFMSPSG